MSLLSFLLIIRQFNLITSRRSWSFCVNMIHDYLCDSSLNIGWFYKFKSRIKDLRYTIRIIVNLRKFSLVFMSSLWFPYYLLLQQLDHVKTRAVLSQRRTLHVPHRHRTRRQLGWVDWLTMNWQKSGIGKSGKRKSSRKTNSWSVKRAAATGLFRSSGHQVRS